MANYSNWYIWFPNGTERRQFVMELLDLKPVEPKGRSKRARKEAKELNDSLELYLNCLEAGKTQSPYYQLNRHYYGGIVPKTERKLPEWNELIVFEKGFRKLYYQNSYKRRPGFWLVVQFRHSDAAGRKWAWVKERIPEERLGTNVPLPSEVVSKDKLESIKGYFDFNNRNNKKADAKNVNQAYQYLLEVRENDPHLFVGDWIYLWETVGFAYNSLGFLDRAIKCLEFQVTFDKENSGIYLNMGAFYNDSGLWPLAFKAYMKGLEINPNDEYIYYNLSSHYLNSGNKEEAFALIDETINANPQRPLNYKLKADMYLEWGFLKEALNSYQIVLDLVDKELKENKITGYSSGILGLGHFGTVSSQYFYVKEIYEKIANIYLTLSKNQQALDHLFKALDLDWEDASLLLAIAKLYEQQKEWKKAYLYAQFTISKEPNNEEAHYLISRALLKVGNNEEAKWHHKQGEKIANTTKSKSNKKLPGQIIPFDKQRRRE